MGIINFLLDLKGKTRDTKPYLENILLLQESKLAACLEKLHTAVVFKHTMLKEL